jgi:hypothetical protein
LCPIAKKDDPQRQEQNQMITNAKGTPIPTAPPITMAIAKSRRFYLTPPAVPTFVFSHRVAPTNTSAGIPSATPSPYQENAGYEACNEGLAASVNPI